MLPLPHRLHRSADFARAVRLGRRCARPALVVHLAGSAPAAAGGARSSASPGAPEPVRAGFVVSRAVGAAVTRNLVTRRLRALVRERLGSLPAGSVLVVRALPAAATTGFRDLGTQLDGCLSQLAVGAAPAEQVSP